MVELFPIIESTIVFSVFILELLIIMEFSIEAFTILQLFQMLVYGPMKALSSIVVLSPIIQ